MTYNNFLNQLQQFSDSDWKALFSGKTLEMLDDQQLRITAGVTPFAILKSAGFEATDPETLKQAVLDNVEAIYKRYYRTHPLSEAGFNYQLKQLANKHGAQSFITPIGKQARYTLFVDDGEVIVEDKNSPRHKYGVFLELLNPELETNPEDAFADWVNSGKAYEDYRGMNVCRYNC